LETRFPLGTAIPRLPHGHRFTDAVAELRGARRVVDWRFDFANLPFAPSEKGASESHAAYQWDRSIAENPLDFPAKFMHHRRRFLPGSHHGGTGFCNRCEPSSSRPGQSFTLSILEQQGPRLGAAVVGALRLVGVRRRHDRIAAVEQAIETPMALSGALRFSLENFLSYMTAALLPVAGIGMFWLLCAIGGWIGRIPFIGQPALGLLWGLELVSRFLMALILIAAVVRMALPFVKTASVWGFASSRLVHCSPKGTGDIGALAVRANWGSANNSWEFAVRVWKTAQRQSGGWAVGADQRSRRIINSSVFADTSKNDR
jgi:hypothetical protein